MNKYGISIAYAVGILLFFLPFVEIKCNATPLYEAKGIDLVTGFTVDEQRGQTNVDNLSLNDNRNEKQEGSVFALGAFVLGIIGLILSFLNFKSQPVVSTITGVLASICLIALMIQVKSDVGKWGSTGKTNTNPDNIFGDMSRNIKVTAEFTTWFYVALISFLIAAFLSYRKGLPAMAQQPPKQAPQLKVENPGDQSEFPKAASESEIG